MQTLTTLIDNEVYRRFHRDLVTSRPVDVHHQADQLFKAGGSPERANVPRYNAPPSATLDEVLHNLKAQRKEIDAWKSERQLFPQNVSLPPTKLDKRAIEPTQEFKAQATDENTALEIERLKAALRRYQEADPVADFVHKDILRIAEQRTREAEDQKRTVLQERDRLVRDLEATKWHNSNLIAERDGAVAEVKKAKEALGALEVTIKEQQQECEKHRRIESALEKQLREFQRRYEALDHHLMELGEQKTAFLEGIRERQSQLDFSVAQLQTTQESLVRAERQRDGAVRRLKECEERLNVLNHDLTEARDRLSQLEDDLSKKTKEHQQSEQNLEDARARNTALTTKLTTAEQKNVDQQALLNKLNASLQSATDKFAQFVKEVEAKETSWATVTQKAWDELQRIKAGDVSTSGVPGLSGFPPTPDGAKRVTSQYENLLSQARFREAELVSCNL